MRIKRRSHWVYLVDALVTVGKAIAWGVIFVVITAVLAYFLLVHIRWS